MTSGYSSLPVYPKQLWSEDKMQLEIIKMPGESMKSNLKIGGFTQNVREVSGFEVTFSNPVPKYTEGTLWLAGPGVFDLEKGSIKHWFDGLGTVSKIEIWTDKVKISNKQIQTTCCRKALKAQMPVIPGLMHPPGPDPSRTFLSKLMPLTATDITDNCRGIVLPFDNRYYVLADSASIYEFNPTTLQTVGCFNAHRVLGLTAINADVVRDTWSGDYFLIGTHLKTNGVQSMVLRTKGKGRLENFELVGTLPSRWKFGPSPALRYSLAVSQNFVVHLEDPLIINIMKAAATFVKGYKMIDWMEYMPEEKSRFHIMHKDSGRTCRVEYLAATPFLHVQVVNAYEEDNCIVVDVTTNPSASHKIFMEGFNLTNMRGLLSPKNYIPGSFERFIIPIIPSVQELRKLPEGHNLIQKYAKLYGPKCQASAVRNGDKVILTPINFGRYDFTTIPDTLRGKKYSFSYQTIIFPSTVSPTQLGVRSGIAKLDMDLGTKKVWQAEKSTHVWIPTFIPDPEGNEEDAGVLVTLVSNLQRKCEDYLVVIDAKEMKEIARAELKEGGVVTYEKGTFVPAHLVEGM